MFVLLYSELSVWHITIAHEMSDESVSVCMNGCVSMLTRTVELLCHCIDLERQTDSYKEIQTENGERIWKRKGNLLFLENPVSGMREL